MDTLKDLWLIKCWLHYIYRN